LQVMIETSLISHATKSWPLKRIESTSLMEPWMNILPLPIKNDIPLDTDKIFISSRGAAA
jgi:hypothetical protein